MTASSIFIVVALIAEICGNLLLATVQITGTAHGEGTEMLLRSSATMASFLSLVLLYFIADFIRCIFYDGISVSVEDELEGEDNGELLSVQIL